MKNNKVLILAGAVLTGLAYAAGRRDGYNEHVNKCRDVLFNVLINNKEKKEES